MFIASLFCVRHYTSFMSFLEKVKGFVDGDEINNVSILWVRKQRLKYLSKVTWLVRARIENRHFSLSSVQCSSSVQCLTLCDPMDCSMPGLPVHHQLLEFTQTHVHWVSDAIQPSHSLSSPSPPALNLSQHQGLYKWVSSSHQVARVLESQLHHQSFQWIFRIDLL